MNRCAAMDYMVCKYEAQIRCAGPSPALCHPCSGFHHIFTLGGQEDGVGGLLIDQLLSEEAVSGKQAIGVIGIGAWGAAR